MRAQLFAAAGAVFGLLQPAHAACPSAEAVAAYAAAWLEGTPARTFGSGLTMEDGLCAQRQLVEQLQPRLGPPVGYKAAATNRRVQEMLRIDAPTRGVLLDKMLLKDRARVPSSALFVFEADLLLQVKDDGINDARQPLEMLRHLSAVIPFIELPSAPSHLAKGEILDGPNLTAINSAARQGVMGAPIPVEPSQAFADALATMQVTLVDDAGQEYARTPGSALMGHPLNVLAWLIQDLKKTGDRLKPGDLVSLGSFSPLLPSIAGRTVTARYAGLPGGEARVSVSFE